MGTRTRRAARRTVKLGLLAAIFYLVWRLVQSRRAEREPGAVEWEPQPFPFPPRPAPAGHHVHIPADVEVGGGPEADLPAEVPEPWTEPADGSCPPSHPVKVKVASGIYHAPGGASYDRTRPDRCYVSTEAAEADGFRPAKR